MTVALLAVGVALLIAVVALIIVMKRKARKSGSKSRAFVVDN